MNRASQDALALDLYLAYLRSAFHTCFYCAAVCDHQEELQRKCIKHARRPLSSPPGTNNDAKAKEEGGDAMQADGDDQVGDSEKKPKSKNKDKDAKNEARKSGKSI